jgi:crossover junction endodeoxyribonuclease RuvC
VPGPDAADALACAICHAHCGQGLGAIATAGFRVRNGRIVGRSGARSGLRRTA